MSNQDRKNTIRQYMATHRVGHAQAVRELRQSSDTTVDSNPSQSTDSFVTWLDQNVSVANIVNHHGMSLGGGELLNVHSDSACEDRGCWIHHPSDHHMTGWPVTWRGDRRIAERTCPHGVGHPDPDDAAYRASIGDIDTTHGCDGCCITPDDTTPDRDTKTNSPAPVLNPNAFHASVPPDEVHSTHPADNAMQRLNTIMRMAREPGYYSPAERGAAVAKALPWLRPVDVGTLVERLTAGHRSTKPARPRSPLAVEHPELAAQVEWVLAADQCTQLPDAVDRTDAGIIARATQVNLTELNRTGLDPRWCA